MNNDIDFISNPNRNLRIPEYFPINKYSGLEIYRVFLFDDMFLTSSCGRNFENIDLQILE